MYATGEKMNITQIEGQFPQAPFPNLEQREAVCQRLVPGAGREASSSIFWTGSCAGTIPFPFIPRPGCVVTSSTGNERMHYIDDALGMCAGLSSFRPRRPPALSHPQLPEVHLGRPRALRWTPTKLTKAVQAVPDPGPGQQHTPGAAPRKTKSPREPLEDSGFRRWKKELLDTYYEFKGWNKDGIPTKESLHETGPGLRERKDFMERGILD